jgi:hypothetical protein
MAVASWHLKGVGLTLATALAMALQNLFAA